MSASPNGILRGIKEKRTREVIRAALKRGTWDIGITGSNHVRLRHESGAVLYTALTTSSARSWRSLHRDIERVERGERPLR